MVVVWSADSSEVDGGVWSADPSEVDGGWGLVASTERKEGKRSMIVSNFDLGERRERKEGGKEGK